MRTHAFRLKPGQDLFDSIQQFAAVHVIRAGGVLCAVGSLVYATLRLADRDSFDEYIGPLEIVSLTGTVSIHGSHLHMSMSDGKGKALGGHLVSGCKIHTTAEIVIADFEELVFKREFAGDSVYEELAVYPG